MKVYVCRDGNRIVAIFSTRESAEADKSRRDESARMYQKTGNFTKYYVPTFDEIIEWVVEP